MINPSTPRETWKEFEQEMQDFVMSVIDIAEEDYGTALNADIQAHLIEWVEYRYLDGRNSRDAEEEYLIWEEHYFTDCYQDEF